MKLYLVRHGETTRNREGRTQGRDDEPLCEEGRAQAELLGQAFKDCKVAAIFSSPLLRAVDTASAIASHHRLDVNVEESLIEIDQGEMDGLTFTEMRSRFGDVLRQWAADSENVRLPGGESMGDVQRRAWAGVQGIRERHTNDSVLLVSHNFVILSIICRAIHLEVSNFRRFRLSPTGVSLLDLGEDDGMLLSFNDTCHLAGHLV
ncbi:MAG: histidine phosphatase family protein [Chloroflexi bacterium]|nr:histidine phosphatase family protein [Chloroflexota bacterium]